MILKSWDELPENLKTEEIRPYYDYLSSKKGSLVLKRIFDITASFTMINLLSPLFLCLAIAIKADSPGPVFYRQERITQYGKVFRIFKFRTMVSDADKIGTQITVNNDARVTDVGKFIRKYRLDETAQLFNVLKGEMSFVGTRPEVKKYVDCYTPEMFATLLLPAGVTSLASIKYKDEAELLEKADNADETYIKEILPEKMKYNLDSLKDFSFIKDIKLMFMTAFAVLGIDIDL